MSDLIASVPSSLSEWIRSTRIRKLALLRGIRIPAMLSAVSTALPLPAILNYGRWVAWCPDCHGKAENVWRDTALFFCMQCGNRSIDGKWRAVTFPLDADEIEGSLLSRPVHEQNWEPDLPEIDEDGEE